LDALALESYEYEPLRPAVPFTDEDQAGGGRACNYVYLMERTCIDAPPYSKK
jgi:hypothetical protein